MSTRRPSSHAPLLEKSLVAMFAQSYKPYSFGAFGKPTKDYVQTAFASNRVVCSQDSKNLLVGAAIFTVLRADAFHKDFSQRLCPLSRGSLYVRHVAVDLAHMRPGLQSLINQLVERAQGAPLWLEIHEENQPLRNEIEKRHSFEYVMTKVMASSDIRGLYIRRPATVNLHFLPTNEIPSVKCLVERFLSRNEMNTIVRELKDYSLHKQPWAQHYSHYNKRSSWTAFALRGYQGDDPGFIAKPAEMSKEWKRENPDLLTKSCVDTGAASSFPFTMRAVERISGLKERIRFMRLAPRGGELARHADVTDRDAGTEDGRVSRLHIPLLTHEDVMFESWGLRGEHQKMHFAAGGLYYLDQRRPHRVINQSPVERVHLVVDVYSTKKLRDLICG